jgi:hypothetical protein
LDYFDNVELKKNNGDIVYPRTKTNGVYDENGDRLDNILKNVPLLSDELTIEDDIPKDNDMLGGQPKSYFEGLVNGVSDRVAIIESVYPQLTNPNLLINPNFQIWQRGTSFTNHGIGIWVYTADRWKLWEGSVSKVSDGLAITKYTTSEYALLTQVLEEHYDNKKVTLSISIDGIIYKVSGIMSTEAFVLPIIGLGTLRCYISAGINIVELIYQSTGTHTINWVKLELGNVTTPFIPRLYAEELVLCQRYYQDSKVCLLMKCVSVGGPLFLQGMYNFPVYMRATPIAIARNYDTGQINQIRNSANGDAINITALSSNSRWLTASGISLLQVVGYSLTIDAYYDFMLTLDAEIY